MRQAGSRGNVLVLTVELLEPTMRTLAHRHSPRLQRAFALALAAAAITGAQASVPLPDDPAGAASNVAPTASARIEITVAHDRLPDDVMDPFTRVSIGVVRPSPGALVIGPLRPCSQHAGAPAASAPTQSQEQLPSPAAHDIVIGAAAPLHLRPCGPRAYPDSPDRRVAPDFADIVVDPRARICSNVSATVHSSRRCTNHRIGVIRSR